MTKMTETASRDQMKPATLLVIGRHFCQISVTTTNALGIFCQFIERKGSFGPQAWRF